MPLSQLKRLEEGEGRGKKNVGNVPFCVSGGLITLSRERWERKEGEERRRERHL